MTETTELPEIERRDLHFELGNADMVRWHPAGVHVTQFFNALSLMFPDGERFFTGSVRHFRDEIDDPRLASEVRGFIGQEAMHGREHEVYNDAVKAAGLPAGKLERAVQRRLNIGRRILSHRAQLGVTIALEHYTAMMADVLLDDERVLEGVQPEMAALWRWHAIEETEHKAVAYDVFQQMTGPVHGYLLRCLMMLHTSLIFWLMVTYNHIRLVWAAGAAGDLRGWLKHLHFGFVRPGMLRRIVPKWLDYFRPGFHPWDRDNRYHVEHWRQAYETTGQPPA